MARKDPSDLAEIIIANGEDGTDAAESANLLQRHLEEQLATIINSARSVAIAAEELLREVSQGYGLGRFAPNAVSMAPRLLAATEQQLLSVSAMLRKC